MHVACASVLSLTVVSSQVVLNSELRDVGIQYIHLELDVNNVSQKNLERGKKSLKKLPS